jgi:hypothetical protein
MDKMILCIKVGEMCQLELHPKIYVTIWQQIIRVRANKHQDQRTRIRIGVIIPIMI